MQHRTCARVYEDFMKQGRGCTVPIKSHSPHLAGSHSSEGARRRLPSRRQPDRCIQTSLQLAVDFAGHVWHAHTRLLTWDAASMYACCNPLQMAWPVHGKDIRTIRQASDMKNRGKRTAGYGPVSIISDSTWLVEFISS